MNALSTAAISAFVVCSYPLDAQDAVPQDVRSGVANPPPAIMDSTPVADSSVTEGYRPTPSSSLIRHQPTPPNTSYSSPGVGARAVPPIEESDAQPGATHSSEDIDAGIVTSVPHAAGELPIGTTFRACVLRTLSTAATPVGTTFSAELLESVQQDGRVVIPSGTLVVGKVTEVRGGRRIHGNAALHLDPRTLVFPDGSRYLIRAQVVDTSESFATRIDHEGTIIRRDHIRQTLVGMGLATGGAIAAGAVIGGGVGALVGAGVGVGLSTAWWLRQDRQTVLPEETALVFSLNEPLMMSIR